MIEHQTCKSFAKKLRAKAKSLNPVSAQIELTYKCNMSCVHCYCKGSEKGTELDTSDWKDILNQIYKEGCIWLTITGGEPLLRRDFLEIYSYAKHKGFLISIFSNGFMIEKGLIEHFVKFPPYSIEITLHSLDEKTYEDITQAPGTFNKVMANIEAIADAELPLVLKTVGLKQNKEEIHNIKIFAENILGKKKFKFDSLVIPRLDGDRTPCLYRLSPEEILEIEELDPDMLTQREKEFKEHTSHSRELEYKYHCNTWFNQFYINPYGRLKFCYMTDKYSSNLREVSFRDGFYNKFSAILDEKYTSSSKCIYCNLREFCYHCPAKAYLEVGDEEKPVLYFCELAHAKRERIDKIKKMPRV
ncbi:MAG: radical SAM protein [Candidatus Omnitrophota bacterium]|nr:MAG: radical SAM protein [Candidatus Omnitrophota bacterium]